MGKYLLDMDPKKQVEAYLERYEDLLKEDPVLLFWHRILNIHHKHGRRLRQIQGEVGVQ